MIGIVTNMMDAACSTSGVLVTAAASERAVVCDSMADDTIWNYVNDFLAGNISRQAFWELARFKHPTHQISFHTIRALACLEFERSEPLHDR